MGITINLDRAQRVLEEAIEWAESPRPVPAVWTRRVARIDACPSKTFTVAFGTAMLAKATAPGIDALALKETSGPAGYSARGVAHGVLVPAAPEFGFDLRATGREPLNNQPFFRYLRIDEIDRIHNQARPYLPDLIAFCGDLNRLNAGQAKAALAAFIRARIAATNARTTVDLRGAGLGVRELIAATDAFIADNPEGGRRGQALVAAAFDLVFDSVLMGRINDPSRRHPGDVQAMDGAGVLVATEVRQKLVAPIEVVQYAGALRAGGVGVGVMAALHPDQVPLDRGEILKRCEEDHGVMMSVIEGVRELLLTAFSWSGRPLEDLLSDFPQHVVARMEEIEVSSAGIAEWADLFDSD